MRSTIAKSLAALAAWVSPKSGAGGHELPAFMPGEPIDTFRRKPEPTSRDLLRELKNLAYTCATMNAAACADSPPRLYVATREGQPPPKCQVRQLPNHEAKALTATLKSARVEEVVEHPILTLLDRANPRHSGFDLLEYTTLYQECSGIAYWLLDFDLLDAPTRIWPLPTHCLTPRRNKGSPNIVDWYDYATADGIRQLPADHVIPFCYPDPRNPYAGGMSPLRAAFEHVSLTGEYLAVKSAVVRNTGLPSAVISPKDAMPQAEADRIEMEFERKFTRGGQGRAIVPTDPVDVKLLERSLGDLAALAEQAASNEAIANAFGVPLSYVTKETNLANLEAADTQYARSIRPRLRRRDATMNEYLVPLFDTSGRLYLQTDDPAGESRDYVLRRDRHDIETGIRTINEVRADRGLEPVPWGAEPWLPLQHAPPSFNRRQETTYAPQTGRNKPQANTGEKPK